MTSVKGFCDARFGKLKQLITDFLSSGDEVGMSLTVNIDGQNLVDIWAGRVEKGEEAQDWQRDTIVNIFSSGKTIASFAVLLLIDRGLVDPDASVANYWPEFAQNGKQNILVRHIISHTSGLSGWNSERTLESLYDWKDAVQELETQAPWWEPGTASGYHSLTMGFLVGELVRRVTGKTYKQFVEEEISSPLGADFQIGVRDEDITRVSDVIAPPPPLESPPQLEPGSIAARTMSNPPFDLSSVNTKEWRQADLGAANAHSNSAGLARILSVLSLGGRVDGRQILSSKTIDLIFQEQANGMDQVVGMPLRFGMGYGITGGVSALDWLPVGRCCFWGGLGGSMVICDLDRRLTITYAMKKLGPVGLGGERAETYVKAIYSAMQSEDFK